MLEITSASSEKLRAFALLAREKKERDARNLCVLDGEKLVRDAVSGGLRLRQLWLTEDAAARYAESLRPAVRAAEEFFVVRDAAAAKLSQLKSPQGVFAAVERPALRSVSELACNGRVLGLCGLQNPENVGAAARTAAALGYGGLLLSVDCADLWSPRALRAGAAAQLFCDVAVAQDYPAAVQELAADGFLTLASALAEDALPLCSIEKPEKLFVAVGSEGQGLPEEVLAACEKRVIIPMSGRTESLNAAAAAAILLWELRA